MRKIFVLVLSVFSVGQRIFCALRENKSRASHSASGTYQQALRQSHRRRAPSYHRHDSSRKRGVVLEPRRRDGLLEQRHWSASVGQHFWLLSADFVTMRVDHPYRIVALVWDARFVGFLPAPGSTSSCSGATAGSGAGVPTSALGWAGAV